MAGADAVIGCSQPGPGVILPDWVRGMGSDPIVFACANPVPEIWPWEAQEAGAAVFATGRSDFPNQANNSLGFPAIFRGALDVRATAITDEMCIAAARELAAVAEEKGLRPDYVIPTMDEWEIYRAKLRLWAPQPSSRRCAAHSAGKSCTPALNGPSGTREGSHR